MLADIIAVYSIKIGVISTIVLFFLIIAALLLDRAKVHYSKALVFITIVLSIVMPTLFFIGSTIYMNTISSSRGPVHWHADIEIWACGEEINLRDPKGLSNKIGTATLHEHNDKRIHLEGVVVTPLDASLGNFFNVIGGTINHRVLAVPTNNGVKSFIAGKACPDGSEAQIQVFAYTTKEGKFTQRKVENPASHIMSPDSQVPDGDCLIIEYGPLTETTNRMCRSYEVSESLGKIKAGGNYGN